jgi:hypothetical protein
MRLNLNSTKLAAAIAPLLLSAAIMVPTASAAPVDTAGLVNVGVQDIPELAQPQHQQGAYAKPPVPVSGSGHVTSA